MFLLSAGYKMGFILLKVFIISLTKLQELFAIDISFYDFCTTGHFMGGQ